MGKGGRDGRHVTGTSNTVQPWATPTDQQPALQQEVLFNLGSYNCSSRHNNLIAFSFEVALLLRVLRSAGATDSDALEVALSLGPVSRHAQNS